MAEQQNVQTPANAMLEMLKVDLTISSTAYDARLAQYLTAAEDAIEQEGVSDLDNTTIPDQMLIIMYAAWMWRKRDFQAGKYGKGTMMPEMLRYKLNNRIFQCKMKVGD